VRFGPTPRAGKACDEIGQLCTLVAQRAFGAEDEANPRRQIAVHREDAQTVGQLADRRVGIPDRPRIDRSAGQRGATVGGRQELDVDRVERLV
jgi:hypothetical protein